VLGWPTYLRYAIWRLKCPHCGVRTEQVPWAAVGSRFTRDLERQVAWLAQRCDLTAVAEHFRISWATVRNIVHRVVEQEWNGEETLDGLRVLGIDEISYRRHHNYLTVIIDHVSGRVVWAGKDRKEAVTRVRQQLVREADPMVRCGSGARHLSDPPDQPRPVRSPAGVEGVERPTSRPPLPPPPALCAPDAAPRARDDRPGRTSPARRG